MRGKRSFVATMLVVGVLAGVAWAQCENVKWDQPPMQIGDHMGMPVYLGWDQYSVWSPDWANIAAADWKCESCAPVKDLHFWGSFINWMEPDVPPDMLPAGFRITFWDDVPVGADPRYPDVWWSHPRQPLAEVIVSDYNWNFVGWDVDPCDPGGPDQWNLTDATFRFDIEFKPEECFFQEPGNTYWVSIGAVYDGGLPNYPWGWKTRPWEDWMIDYGVSGEPSPGGPFPFEWDPLRTDCQPEWWDLSYVLTMAFMGDANLDGLVDGADYTLWADNYGGFGGWMEGNFNCDAIIDGADYTLWADNYLCGTKQPVPEPATMLVLALGACLPLLRRRR